MSPTRAAPLVVLLVLSACAEAASRGDPASPYMFRGRCASSDWYEIGFHNGYTGRPPERFTAYQTNCSQLGTAPDRERYFAGYADGRAEAGL